MSDGWLDDYLAGDLAPGPQGPVGEVDAYLRGVAEGNLASYAQGYVDAAEHAARYLRQERGENDEAIEMAYVEGLSDGSDIADKLLRRVQRRTKHRERHALVRPGGRR